MKKAEAFYRLDEFLDAFKSKLDSPVTRENGNSGEFRWSGDQDYPELMTQQLHCLLLKLDRKMKAGNDIQKAFNLLRGFASAFSVKYGDFEIGISREHATGDLSLDLSDLFIMIGRASKSRDTVSVILVDEVQYLTKDDLSALIIALHKIFQEQLPLLFFGAGLPQLAKLAGETRSYAERLFDFPVIDKLDHQSAKQALEIPAKEESVKFEKQAIDEILKQTECYPFFLQVWGSCSWDVAEKSPITLFDVKRATNDAVNALDTGFFKVRYDRLTSRQQEYVRAIAEVGHLPATSTEVANILNITIKKAAPIRDEIIKKGMALSPSWGKITFSVPKFDEFLRRIIPGKDFHTKSKP